jgi:hypothetical protein
MAGSDNVFKSSVVAEDRMLEDQEIVSLRSQPPVGVKYDIPEEEIKSYMNDLVNAYDFFEFVEGIPPSCRISYAALDSALNSNIRIHGKVFYSPSKNKFVIVWKVEDKRLEVEICENALYHELKNAVNPKFVWMRGETFNSNISMQPVTNFSIHTTVNKDYLTNTAMRIETESSLNVEEKFKEIANIKVVEMISGDNEETIIDTTKEDGYSVKKLYNNAEDKSKQNGYYYKYLYLFYDLRR